MTLETDLTNAGNALKKAAQILKSVAEGGNTQTVNNGNEDLPTLSKFFKDAGDAINAGGDSILAAAQDAAALSVSAKNSSQTAAASSQASLAAFNDKYYGALASDPTTKPSGSPSTSGDIYFNTVSNKFRQYSGTAWSDYDVAAQAAAILAQQARDQAMTIQGMYTSKANGVNTALSVGTRVGGTGGTNGTFPLVIPAPGAGGTQAVGTITVSGNALTSAALSNAGANYAADIVFDNTALAALSAGLTGASLTLKAGGGVAFNKYFSVPSDVSAEYVNLYQNVAGVASLIKTGVSSNAVMNAKPTSGDLSPTTANTVSIANGATKITVSGRDLGFTIPAGQTGVSSYVIPVFGLTSAMLGVLAGQVIRIKVCMDVSANFLAEKTFNSTAVRVNFVGGSFHSNDGSVVRTEQIGTKLYREYLYTVIGTEASIGGTLQITSSASTANTHTMQISSVSFSVEPPTAEAAWSPADLTLAARLADSLGLVAARHFGIGPVYQDAAPVTQVFNGAVVRALNGKNFGFTIPAGSTGQNSLSQFWLPIDAADQPYMVNKTIKITLGFDTSAGFAISMQEKFQSKNAAGTSTIIAPSNVVVTSTSTRRMVSFNIALPADFAQLGPYEQTLNTGAVGADTWLQLTDYAVEIVGPGMDSLTLMEENQRIALARNARGAVVTALSQVNSGYAVTKTVKPDGTGDFTSLKLALAGITDASVTKKYEVVIYPGIYTDTEYFMKDYVDVRGVDRESCWLKGELADNAALATISNTSTIWLTTNTKISNMKITMKNGRYPIHADGSGANVNVVEILEDNHIEHFGNDGARAYQTSIGQDPNLVWASEHAFGAGLASGMQVTARRNTFKSSTDGFYFHTNKDFAAPAKVILENNRLLSTGANGAAVSVQPLGSGQRDTLELKGNQMLGGLTIAPQPWLSTSLSNQPANQAEIRISGYGNTGLGGLTIYGYDAKALQITSATTGSTSSVAVSGTAATVLFGTAATLPNGTGLNGGVRGSISLTESSVGSPAVFITSMGKRLGDCSAVNKVLTITFNGVTAINVTFNSDYTAVSNATILALIAAAIGANGTASFVETTPLTRPRFTDQEISLQNTGASAIKMGFAVAYGADDRSGRVMTNADAASLFAGICYEEVVPPGAWFRVKKAGVVTSLLEIVRSDAAAYSRGDTFGIGATPGQFTKGAAIPLLKAINSRELSF